MKKTFSKIFRIVKWVLIVILALISLFFIIRIAGRLVNARTPKNGINESRFVKLNGSRQWISIYGKNKDNPVLLYLHGGPGSATSPYEHAFTRQWADVFTVVTWDQRNCGKSYSPSQNNTELTHAIFLQDGLELTKFILSYLGKEKITILGHSWGSLLGANLVLEFPEYYDAFIGCGQVVDFDKNEELFVAAAKTWAQGDPSAKKLLQALSKDSYSSEYLLARQAIMKKYGYDLMHGGSDYNFAAAVIFNPYYSIGDIIGYLQFFSSPGFKVYENFLNSEEFKKFALNGRYEYQVPYYNINGDRDYQANFELAQEYFDKVQAPRKKLYLMKDCTHGLLETRSEEFSKILHEIATEHEHIR